MRTRIKLLIVNVALAALAAFLGALAVLPAGAEIDKAALAAGGYAALRAAIGLGAIYADKLSAELRGQVPYEAGH